MKRFLFLAVLFINGSAFAQQRSVPDSIKTILEKIYEIDQKGSRGSIESYAKKYGNNSAEFKQLMANMRAEDKDNQKIVFPILDKYGWLGKKQVSEKAAQALFLVIQHAELESQKKYLPLVEQGFKAGDVEPWAYAIFHDRINTREGRFQVYGSQSFSDPLGNSYIHPIMDEPNINRRRSKMGMDPIEEQMKRYGIMDYKRPTTDLLKGKIVMIGHMMDSVQHAVEGVKVYVKDKLIGTSNAKGFFNIPMVKAANEELVVSLQKDGHKPKLVTLKGDKDVFDIYIQFK